MPNVHYVVQQVPTHAPNYVQGHGPDGQPVTLLNFDAAPLQGFQPITVPMVNSNDGTTTYAVPLADQGSSTSSVTSSISGFARNGSGGSLSAYATNADSSGHGKSQMRIQHSGMPVLHSSASDGNIARRMRSPSYGSASDTSFYDPTVTSTSISRNTSAGSWRNEHSSASPLDHQRRSVPLGQYGTARTDAGAHASASSGGEYSPHLRSRVPPSGGVIRPRRSRGQGGGEGGDEGFTMMTSALLNLLDTPEEVGAVFEGDPRMYAAAYPPTAQGDELDPNYFDRLSLRETIPNPGPPPRDQSWPPNTVPPPPGHPPRGGDDTIQVMPHHSQHSHPGNDVGLYLS